MNPVVFAALRHDGAERTRSAGRVLDWWQEQGFPVQVAEQHPDSPIPFLKSKLYNAAARHRDWDVGIFIDTDVLPASIDPIHLAMKLAHKSGWLHFPHTHKTALSEAGTQAFYDGVPLHKCEAEDDADHTFSSVVIVPRDLYEEVGGYDERFVGWGWEDLAFFWACATMAGYDRVGGAVYHLWHPQSRADTYESPHYRANEELGHRYMEAKWNQTKMRSLLTEDRTSADGSTSTAG